MNPSQAARACGIDFGTSNSTVGWWRPDMPALVPLEDGRVTLPSAVFFNADEDSTCYGRAALAEYLDGYEGRLMRALKSLLGSSLIDGHTEVLGRQLPFRALLRQFIAELKLRAEQVAGRPFEHAVFGRPVHFVDDDAEADRRAEDTLAEIGRAVGFKELSFQFEPIAAAYHFEQTLEREALVAVIDIGGGTSDFSLIRLGPERRMRDDRREDLLGHAGVHVGGTDFDRVLSLAAVMPHLGLRSKKKNGTEVPSHPFFKLATWHTINFCYTRAAWSELQDIYRDAAEREKLDRLLDIVSARAGHWLAMQVEAAKIALSDTAETPVAFDRDGASAPVMVTRAQFDDAIDPLLDRVEGSLRGLLADAGVSADAVDTLFFTGGSSGVPALRERVARVFPGARSETGDLFGSIGSGLAVEAARRYG